MPPIELVREPGRFIIRDRDAGYFRELSPADVSRIAAQAASLVHGEVICRGVIPAPTPLPNSDTSARIR